MITRRLVLVLSILLLSACSLNGASVSPASPSSGTLTVFAAASLNDAFNELGSAFEASHPGVDVRLNYAGSQALRTQIEQGAPADVMVSANPGELDTLVSEGYVERSMHRLLVTNKLVVILPPTNPAHLTDLRDLARPGIKLVLAAEDVPVGKYARQSLNKMDTSVGPGFSRLVLNNVVSNEDNTRQVVAKVQLGEADAGIVYSSDAVSDPQLQRLDIPDAMNVIAQYEIAPLADSPRLALASQFVDYTLSPSAQSILSKWGFIPHP